MTTTHPDHTPTPAAATTATLRHSPASPPTRPTPQQLTTRNGADAIDHGRRRRRRGEVLRCAILEATLEELNQTGYLGLRLERVAARARASKGSIYRRWPTRADLVADAIDHALPPRPPAPDTGSVRTDLLIYLHHAAVVFNGPCGQALRGLMADTLRASDLMAAIRARFLDPTISQITDILTRGAARGQVRPTALTPRIASLAPDLLREHFQTHHTLPDNVITEIIDDILMPLINPDPPTTPTQHEPPPSPQ